MKPPFRSSVDILLNILKPLANRYTGFLLFILSYTLLIQSFGGLPSIMRAWRLEIPLLLYLYFYCNLITRSSRLQPLIAALPITMIYLIFDAYYVLFGRLLRVVEVTELPEMFLVIPFLNKVSLVLIVGLPLGLFFSSVSWRRLQPLALGAVPLLVLTLTVECFPSGFMTTFKRTLKPIDWMSDSRNAANNGRLSMTLYNEARRVSSLEKTMAYRDNNTYLSAFDDVVQKVRDVKQKNNVHLIVLESFLDPNLLLNARFSQNPEHPSFTALFANKGGLSISPVFGGATAQAEFEVLCGVPAMRELSGIEFDVFTGAQTLCLPNILRQVGYQTMASNAFIPDFFNSTKGYTGVGFEKIYYPQEHAAGMESYFKAGDLINELFMYDGDLLSSNLNFVKEWIKRNPGKPLLNYIMTIYGHTPHLLDLAKRPRIVAIERGGTFLDDQLERAVNQYYYRTQVIASYVRELIRIDPHSIIILVSDHLPSLTYGPNTYNDLRYLDNTDDAIHLNRIYIVEDGQPTQYGIIRHYDVPRLVLNYLTMNRINNDLAPSVDPSGQHVAMASLREQYMAVMAHAMDGKPIFPYFLSPDIPSK